ncbi:MAG: peptide MFS transporter [Bacteroidota bacterium]
MSNSEPKSIFGHEIGLFNLFFTEMWERFSYYGMRAILVLYLISEIALGGWALERSEALQIYAFYTGLVYLTPIIGGYLADKFLGYRWAVILGGLLMTLGHASLAFETKFFFYVGLVLLILGNGLFKPNISSMVGKLYEKNQVKKDAAYTIFYMGINAGAFLGILLCGYLGEKVSWAFGFGLAGIFMFFGLLAFYFGQGIFGKIGLVPTKKFEMEELDYADGAVNEDGHLEEESGQYMPEGVPKAKVERDRLVVISVFAFFTIFFWMAFEQAGGSMTIFASDYTQRELTGFNANLFRITNTILTIVPLAAVTYVLIRLSAKTIQKYSLSVVFLGLSFLIIWGISLWMLNREFNMKTYEIEYTVQATTQTDSLVTNVFRDPATREIGATVPVLDIDGRGKLKLIEEAEISKYKKAYTATIKSERKGEIEVPATWFGILNSFFIIALAPFFSKIWESRLNPSGPVKFAIGLILLGLGFAALAYGGRDIAKGADTATVSMAFLCIAYWLHTMGELCVSPVGLSYVSKLAPVRLAGLMFGVWFLANFFANTLAGLSGSLIDQISEKYSISGFFLIFTIIPIAAGIVMIILNPTLKRMMHGVE